MSVYECCYIASAYIDCQYPAVTEEAREILLIGFMESVEAVLNEIGQQKKP
ncbi:MAG: hypothetical protein FWF59_09645 [Turicibacter sp.]|nr:hypothetical protein [Turicibacter sp.]